MSKESKNKDLPSRGDLELILKLQYHRRNLLQKRIDEGIGLRALWEFYMEQTNQSISKVEAMLDNDKPSDVNSSPEHLSR